ncbi:hypothetical protein Pcinc_004071 [Petrolisthes cinctipes]|uniref:G-protein coupled receptors family 1 profile domain-containing protein n=1 Tax=Petrolisthes cinctipes TaxID=88211 RepID=A0AAE1L0N5_PETCI|nr:hypothetical protein Pcinc_004071 [Petrolisthes cinctipes]
MTVMLPQTGRPNNTITYRRRSWLLSLSGKYGGLETIAWEMANMTLFDLVEPKVTHKVPKYWHSFPPPHPLWHLVLGTLYAIIGTQLSMRRAGLWLLLIWVYSGGWCALPFFGWNQYVLEGLMTSCTFDYLSMDTWSRSYVVVLFLASYAVPLVVVCYAYFGIVSSVSRHDRNLKSHERAQGENVRYQNLQRRESQLNRVVFTSVLAFMIAWTPYAG